MSASVGKNEAYEWKLNESKHEGVDVNFGLKWQQKFEFIQSLKDI